MDRQGCSAWQPLRASDSSRAARGGWRRARGGGPSLATNREFKSAVADGGDAPYLSDLHVLFAVPGADAGPAIKETGALKISNNSWTSSYHLTFNESEWSKPLLS